MAIQKAKRRQTLTKGGYRRCVCFVVFVGVFSSSPFCTYLSVCVSVRVVRRAQESVCKERDLESAQATVPRIARDNRDREPHLLRLRGSPGSLQLLRWTVVKSNFVHQSWSRLVPSVVRSVVTAATADSGSSDRGSLKPFHNARSRYQEGRYVNFSSFLPHCW